jgi:hypothetical protein
MTWTAQTDRSGSLALPVMSRPVKQPTAHWSIEVHFDATIVDPVQRFSQAGFYRNDPKHVHTGKCGVVLGAGNKGKPVSPETHFGLCGGGYTHGPLVAATCKGSAFTRQWGGMEWDGPRRQYSTGFGTGVLSICDTLHLLFEKGMVVFLKHHPIRAYVPPRIDRTDSTHSASPLCTID